MKRFTFLLTLLILSFTGAAIAAPSECTICVGAVAELPVTQATAVPLLISTSENDMAAAGAAVSSLTSEQRRQSVVIVSFSVAENGDALTNVEQKTRNIVEWARIHGPFDTLGISPEHSDPAVVAYAIKRATVSAQGLNVASRIALGSTPLDRLQQLFDNGAQPYFDAVIVAGENVAATAAWLMEKDPSKKIFAVVSPASPNPMYDLGRALADGATRAYLAGPVDFNAIAGLNRALGGDWAYDATAKNAILDAKGNETGTSALTFVRGEDLRTMIIPRGDATNTTIVAIAGDQYEKPTRVDVAGERAVTDSGKRVGKLLVGVKPSSQPFLLYVSRSEKPSKNVTREAIEVATQRGITVEEIIRNHQAYDAYQESIQPRYIARNTTKLRFDINGTEAVEATIAGDYFSDPQGRSDWVWQEFLINGVRWKYGRIPELPLIQAEKVTQLPLDIHLTNEYRYSLARETDLLGYRTYEVRFEPPAKAPEGLPLYRGTVWIDAKTWARIRISMIQLNLTGEVLSNEERVDFQPFASDTKAPLTSADVARLDGRSIIWLPAEVAAQQVISAAGRATPVQRTTSFSRFQMEPEDFETRLKEVAASDARMVRETEAGLRYLEKRGSGERVVKEGFDTSRLFMLGGVHHDSGLEFPVVPLGGIDYFNFNLADMGIQTNVFFAGVILAANATHPNVADTRTNIGADFFGIAIPVENTMYRGGQERKSETVKQVPLVLTLRAGHPIFDFGKVDLSFTAAHLTYQRADDTARDFAVPSDTFLFGPTLSGEYNRRGYTFRTYADYTTRTSWEPWGNPEEFDADQKSFLRYGASIGKSFYLPKFQRLGIDINYLDGQRLDRFSKYELGFFGAQRVHGIESGSVRAERAFLGHLSYGFVFSDLFRMEAFYDHALIDDQAAGMKREPFQGLGIAGQTVGPYGTLLRLDIGKTIGQNRQDGFVANVVFLKLF